MCLARSSYWVYVLTGIWNSQVSWFPLPDFTYSHGKWVQTSGSSFRCQITSGHCTCEIWAEFCGEERRGRRRKGMRVWKAIPYLIIPKWIIFRFCSTALCLAQRQPALYCSMEREIGWKLNYKQGTICAVAAKSKLWAGLSDIRKSPLPCDARFCHCLGEKYYIGVAQLLIHMKVKVPIVALEETIFIYSQCI